MIAIWSFIRTCGRTNAKEYCIIGTTFDSFSFRLGIQKLESFEYELFEYDLNKPKTLRRPLQPKLEQLHKSNLNSFG